MADVRYKNKGFTLVELLTVLAIITMLVGLLMPSVSMVRRVAKETKQRAELAAIGSALTTFRNDYGDYPPSDRPLPGDYGGAQKLAEALLGLDLMGFHPWSNWNAIDLTLYPDPLITPPADFEANLRERRGRYLELGTTNAFRLGGPEGLFNLPPTNPLFTAAHTFVLCDVFGSKKITIGGKTVRAGTPVLYYRADTSSKKLAGVPPGQRIYDADDNQDIILVKDLEGDGRLGEHPLGNVFPGDYQNFYEYIRDRRVGSDEMPWPYRPDSYLLITAGADGIYGTEDDICNFGN